MPGFHSDEEILFTRLAAPLLSLSCSLRNSLIFLLLSLACHASLWLLLFLTVPVVYSSCLQGLPGTHPLWFLPFLLTFHQFSSPSRLFCQVMSRGNSLSWRGADTASWVTLGSRAFSLQSSPFCSFTFYQVSQIPTLQICQPAPVRTTTAASALSAAQNMCTGRLTCTSSHGVTSLCAAEHKGAHLQQQQSPPETVRAHQSSRFYTRPLLSLHAVHHGLSPNECNLQKFHRQDKCRAPPGKGETCRLKIST